MMPGRLDLWWREGFSPVSGAPWHAAIDWSHIGGEPLRTRTKVIAASAVVAAVAAGSAGVVAAASGDDTEAPITGDALDRASTAALEHTGGGSVTDTEVGDEDSYYEVEVTLEDGRQVDVQLDEQFNVVSSAGDHDDAGEDAPDD